MVFFDEYHRLSELFKVLVRDDQESEQSFRERCETLYRNFESTSQHRENDFDLTECVSS